MLRRSTRKSPRKITQSSVEDVPSSAKRKLNLESPENCCKSSKIENDNFQENTGPIEKDVQSIKSLTSFDNVQNKESSQPQSTFQKYNSTVATTLVDTGEACTMPASLLGIDDRNVEKIVSDVKIPNVSSKCVQENKDKYEISDGTIQTTNKMNCDNDENVTTAENNLSASSETAGNCTVIDGTCSIPWKINMKNIERNIEDQQTISDKCRNIGEEIGNEELNKNILNASIDITFGIGELHENVSILYKSEEHSSDYKMLEHGMVESSEEDGAKETEEEQYVDGVDTLDSSVVRCSGNFENIYKPIEDNVDIDLIQSNPSNIEENFVNDSITKITDGKLESFLQVELPKEICCNKDTILGTETKKTEEHSSDNKMLKHCMAELSEGDSEMEPQEVLYDNGVDPLESPVVKCSINFEKNYNPNEDNVNVDLINSNASCIVENFVNDSITKISDDKLESFQQVILPKEICCNKETNLGTDACSTEKPLLPNDNDETLVEKSNNSDIEIKLEPIELIPDTSTLDEFPVDTPKIAETYLSCSNYDDNPSLPSQVSLIKKNSFDYFLIEIY